MSAETVEDLIHECLPKLTRLNAVVRFDLGRDGQYVIDARTAKPTLIDEPDGTDDCVIKISAENLVKLIRGEMDPMLGYTLGRIKVGGSMGVAMKLVSAIS